MKPPRSTSMLSWLLACAGLVACVSDPAIAPAEQSAAGTAGSAGNRAGQGGSGAGQAGSGAGAGGIAGASGASPGEGGKAGSGQAGEGGSSAGSAGSNGGTAGSNGGTAGLSAGSAGSGAGQAGVGQAGSGAGGTAGASGTSPGEGGKAGSGQAGEGGSSGQGGEGGGAGSAGQGGMLPLTEKTICGTWVLQQAASAAELAKKQAAIEAALSTPNVRGFSLRVPWKAIEKDLSLLEAGRVIAEAKGVDYSIRFMAGRHTPEAVFAAGAHFWTFNGEKIPKPFSDDGVPGNPAFEKAYAAIVKKLASYSRANGVRLLHLAWHGRMWAEIDQEGPAGTPGYSLDAWLEGHQKLVDIGLTEASDELSIEFPMSGHWVQSASGAGPLASYMTTKVGKLSPLLYVQGNGLGMFNGAPSKSLRRGMQMYDLKTTYDWAAVYDTLYAAPQATYVELYTDNFGGSNKAPLEAQITKFHTAACKP